MQKLFSAFTDLTSFKLLIEGIPVDMDMETAVDSLVQQNRQLQTLDISGIPLSDSDLVSLSRLSSLSALALCTDFQRFTTSGVLALLTGATRHTLLQADLRSTDHLIKDEIEQEIQSIGAEKEQPLISCHISENDVSFQFE